MKTTDVQPRIELEVGGVFIDLSDRLLSMTSHRGKGHPQDDQSVGVCELLLRNHDQLINADTFEPGLPGRVIYRDSGPTAQLRHSGTGVFANWTNSGVVDVPMPDSSFPGDLLLTSVGFNHSGTITGPAGWTEIWQRAGPNGSAGQWYFLRGPGPPADIRWLIDGAATHAGGVCTSWTAPAGFVHVVVPTATTPADFDPPTSNPLAWAGLIPPPPIGASLVPMFAAPAAPLTITPPSNFAGLVDISIGGDQVFMGVSLAPLGFKQRTAPAWQLGAPQSVVVGAAMMVAVLERSVPTFFFADQQIGTNVISPDFDIDTLDAGFAITGRIATDIVPAAPGARIINVWSGSQTNRKMQLFMRDDSSLRFQVQTTSGGVSLTTAPVNLTGIGLAFTATYTPGGQLTFSVEGEPLLTNPGPLDPLQGSTLALTIASRADLGETGTGWLGLAQDFMVIPNVGPAIRLDGEDVGTDGPLDGVSWTEGAGGHTWDASGAVSLDEGRKSVEDFDVFLGTTLSAKFSREFELKNRTVTITLQDDTRILTNVEEAQWPDTGSGDTVAERVERLLDVAGWVNPREIGGGFGTLEAMPDSGTNVADEMFEAVQRDEVGQWAVLADRTFRQLSRDQLFDPEPMQSAIIIGRQDLPISFGDAEWSTDRLINRAIGNRQQGGGQPNLIFEDQESIDKYGVYADSFLEYSHQTNGETLSALVGEISFYSLPTLDNDILQLWPVRGDWSDVFATIDLLDPLIVWENGEFRQTVVYGIGHQWEAQAGWSMTLQLWQYVGGQLDDLLKLDDPAEGLLDQNKLGAGTRRGARPIIPI